MSAVAAFVRDADRDRWLATLYAPEPVRPALLAVHALDLELAKVVATTTEPMIGRIRLAWWRERLEALEHEVPAQPVLQALAADVLPRGVAGAGLAAFEDAWLALLDGDDERHVKLRGAALGTSLATLLGGDPAIGSALLATWAAGESARYGRAVGQGVPTPGAPRALRPVAGFAALGHRDVQYAMIGRPPEPRATPGRQLVLLRASLFGR